MIEHLLLGLLVGMVSGVTAALLAYAWLSRRRKVPHDRTR
jgi:hypothetical protein